MVVIEMFPRCPDGGFVQVEACHIPPPDFDYIAGAIRLCVNGLEIIGIDEWNYADQLWCYIAHMVTELRSSGYADTCLPDQPIKPSFQTSGARILVTAKIGGEVKEATAASADLLDAIKAAGLIFFRKMTELAPADS